MVRAAQETDIPAITEIYNQGIEDRVATFETEMRTPAQICAWLAQGYPCVVAEAEGAVRAYAAVFPYRPRDCYSGIGEFSIYVARDARGRGLGRLALQALIEEAERQGYWKLLSRIFPDNATSRKLCARLGFREVGIYRNHAQLDGVWRDVVIVEKLLGEGAN